MFQTKISVPISVEIVLPYTGNSTRNYTHYSDVKIHIRTPWFQYFLWTALICYTRSFYTTRILCHLFFHLCCPNERICLTYFPKQMHTISIRKISSSSNDCYFVIFIRFNDGLVAFQRMETTISTLRSIVFRQWYQ